MALADIAMPEPVRAALRNAVRTRQLPPAYLFVGPAGVGKRATALALAQMLNCRGGSAEACDRCPSCRRIAHGMHPDVHVIEPQGQAIRIDQIRQLHAQLMLQAYEGGTKVAVLDDAERLTGEAANALLKVLEEPPARTLFVLISQTLGGVPATVVSRAQVLRFGLLSPAQIVELLRQRRYSPADAERAARLCGGRPGRALALSLSALLSMRQEALQLLTQAQAGEAAALLASAEPWAKRKGEHELLFELLLSLVRDLAVVRAGGDAAALMHADLQTALAPLAAAVPVAVWGEIFDIIQRSQQAMARNANPQLALEAMLLHIGDAYERARQRERRRPHHSAA
jgi:DNA polymerase-3 subunit delta'